MAQVRALRKSYNKELFSDILLSAEVFSSNTPESQNKKEEVQLLRDLNELYLNNELTIDSDVTKQFLTLGDGIRAEAAVKALPKGIIDIIRG